MVLFYLNLYIDLKVNIFYFTIYLFKYCIFNIYSTFTNVNSKVDISVWRLPPLRIGRRNYSNINRNSEYYFNSYLAGLIEGDGHFNVPKFLKNLKGKVN